MRNYVIGTIGHIDHGKTTIVKAISGIDTDTLIEEKKRGITVNLGFAYFKLDDQEVGIIDVPGHEKLIKNMLAGVFGIDLVLVVVAANDGIMPQTREHVEIIKYLGIENTLVVITKTDLVDQDRINEVKKSITTEFGFNDFCEFSIKENAVNLIKAIQDKIKLKDDVEEDEFFRMPIDRVFSVKGFGTVVTGTCLSGSVKVGDSLEVLPSRDKVKVKGIQVHKKSVDSAHKHMRVALNVNKAELSRGKIIAAPNKIMPSKILDVKLTLNGKLELKHLEKVKFYYFSDEVNARVKLFNQKVVSTGTVFCQLLLEEELYATKKDRGIIRKLNPNVTIAGVQVMNELGTYANRFDELYSDRIELFDKDDSTSLLDSYLESNLLNHSEDIKKQGLDIADIDSTVFKIENYYITKKNLDKLSKMVLEILFEFHENNKYVLGINKQELKNKLGLTVKSRIINGILDLIEDVEYKDYVKLKSFHISFNAAEQKMMDSIILYIGNTFKPPKYGDIYMNFQTKEFENVFFSLVKKKELVKIDDDIYLSKVLFNKLTGLLDKFFENNTVLELSDARMILDSSRRYVVPYLEYLDKIGYTARKETGRVKRMH